MKKTIQIAIDGPSGSGKSTLAKAVARTLGILYLDTGAMYRALGWKVLQSGMSTSDEPSVQNVMDAMDLQVVYQQGHQHVLVDGVDVTEAVRTQPVAQAASNVSRYPGVRQSMVQRQKAIAASQNVVMDGRDIGTYVLPSAEFKFYVTASVEVRAHRRLAELKEKGIQASWDELCQEIAARDEQDMNRAASPLRQAPDAILLDTSSMSADEVLQVVLNKINTDREDIS